MELNIIVYVLSHANQELVKQQDFVNNQKFSSLSLESVSMPMVKIFTRFTVKKVLA